MQGRLHNTLAATGAILSMALLCATTRAQETDPAGGNNTWGEDTWGRYEFWAGPVAWPGLDDIQPQRGGFDTIGLGLGLGAHLGVRRFENSDLLLGIDLTFSGVDSNIDGYFSTVMAQHIFLGGSAKWIFGPRRNVSLDAGFGWHEVEIADMSTVFWGIEETLWSSGRWATWAGVTWDIGQGRPGKNGGLFLAARAHFVDFGNVRDEGPVSAPVLGPAAGKLDGPIYFLEIGYSGR